MEQIEGQFLFVNEEQLRNIIREEVTNALTQVKEKPRRMYTRFEVRDIFNVTLGTIDNWANKGSIKKIHVGRKVFFDADEIDKLVKR